MFSRKIWHYLILFLFALLGTMFVFWQWTITSNAQEAINLQLNNLQSFSLDAGVKREKPKIRTVKGLYLTAYSAGNPQKIDEIIKLIDDTELNAVVIDIKDYSGKILFDNLGDAEKLIKKLHQRGIYVIARQTVFQDPVLAEKNHELAVKDVGGVSTSSPDGLWRDKKGLAWVDPSIKSVWSYNLAIAKKAIKMGFDEINFDYVRFPSDGDMSRAVFALNGRSKTQVMRDFFKHISEKLSDEPVWISIDMFGFVMEKHSGLSIGQRLADAVDYVDFICPMMYPSHYPSGHLNFDNPAEHPAEVIENGMKLGLPFFDDKRSRVRPWIQAFDIGAVYSDGALIRAQIDAVEKYSGAGWLMWNAANRYSSAGLRAE